MLPLIKVLTRLNKSIVVKPNPDLPVNEILTTEYSITWKKNSLNRSDVGKKI